MQRTVNLIIKLHREDAYQEKRVKTHSVKSRESTDVVKASRDMVESHNTHEILR